MVKDNIGVTGFPTSAGSHALKDLELPDAFLHSKTAPESQNRNLRQNHLTELAGFVTSNVLPYGYSELGGFGQNPHGNFPCGGSSAGSAIAVAAGFLRCSPLALKTRGSLMIPGFRNGVYSFKPTRGLVSRTGIIPLSSSFDAPGVLTRNPALLKEVFLSMIGVDPADDQSFELRSKESKPSRKRIILCVNRSLGEMELLQTKLRSFLAQLKLNGFEIIFIDLPEVSFDYKTISSTDIRADITKFLHRYGSDNEPRSFEGLVECYRERPHAHLYGMERLEDALAMPQIEKSELKKLVQENVAKARNLIDDILAHYNADFVGFLNFVDWFSIGGGPSCTLPVSFETKPPISIMLGARVGNDLAILHLVKELSEIAKGAQHVEKLDNKAE